MFPPLVLDLAFSNFPHGSFVQHSLFSFKSQPLSVQSSTLSGPASLVSLLLSFLPACIEPAQSHTVPPSPPAMPAPWSIPGMVRTFNNQVNQPLLGGWGPKGPMERLAWICACGEYYPMAVDSCACAKFKPEKLTGSKGGYDIVNKFNVVIGNGSTDYHEVDIGWGLAGMKWEKHAERNLQYHNVESTGYVPLAYAPYGGFDSSLIRLKKDPIETLRLGADEKNCPWQGEPEVQYYKGAGGFWPGGTRFPVGDPRNPLTAYLPSGRPR
ncbi:hypothetical protein B0H63DRAFT_479806 [Podospora didyma]|uniref:Uncharacterized protein n=1 Tax=Podospora didyma TaxID=330526 RepID=A0AAE0NBZ4_9PEZI|nr:hypothetical protein B0H63DRAFT_479806 [Podospora didyma]